jgi:hypothetical protein
MRNIGFLGGIIGVLRDVDENLTVTHTLNTKIIPLHLRYDFPTRSFDVKLANCRWVESR